MGFKFSKRSYERLEGVDQRIIWTLEDALKISPIDFGIPEHGGLRTVDVQHSLFIKGLSKCDGRKSKSVHQSGWAVDVFAYVNGKASWKPRHLSMVATSILQCAPGRGLKAEWGGFFRPLKTYPYEDYEAGWDMAHHQFEEL